MLDSTGFDDHFGYSRHVLHRPHDRASSGKQLGRPEDLPNYGDPQVVLQLLHNFPDSLDKLECQQAF